MYTSFVKSPLVFIIEDSVAVAGYIELALKHFGFKTMVALDGLEASQKLPTISPEIILLDLDLPKVNGLALFKQIKELPHLQASKVVLISGWSQLPEFIAKGVDLILTKPIRLNKLRNLNEVLGYPSHIIHS